MNDQPRLSDAEWALVIDLLQHELHELPVEIRHTRSSDLHQGLHRRLEMVRSLLERLQARVAV